MDNDSTIKLLAGLGARHLMTVAAGALVTNGLLHTGSDETSFINLGVGILVGVAGIGWSWWQKSGQQTVAAALKRITGHVTTTAAVATANALPQGAAAPKY